MRDQNGTCALLRRQIIALKKERHIIKTQYERGVVVDKNHLPLFWNQNNLLLCRLWTQAKGKKNVFRRLLRQGDRSREQRVQDLMMALIPLVPTAEQQLSLNQTQIQKEDSARLAEISKEKEARLAEISRDKQVRLAELAKEERIRLSELEHHQKIHREELRHHEIWSAKRARTEVAYRAAELDMSFKQPVVTTEKNAAMNEQSGADRHERRAAAILKLAEQLSEIEGEIVNEIDLTSAAARTQYESAKTTFAAEPLPLASETGELTLHAAAATTDASFGEPRSDRIGSDY